MGWQGSAGTQSPLGAVQSCEGVAGEGFPGLLGDANRGTRIGPLKFGVGDAHRTQQVSRHASGNIDMRASLTHAHAHKVA